MGSFQQDRYPGQPKILFVGIGSSSHTHSWIDLLENAPFNVRLFSIMGNPPPEWSTKSYLAAPVLTPQPAQTRQLITPYSDKLPRLFASAYFKLTNPQRWLAQVIEQWKPDIVHTLGLDPAAEFYLQTIQQYKAVFERITPIWITQIRGGPDLALRRLMPEYQGTIQDILQQCTTILADNVLNYDYCLDFHIDRQKLASLGVVPGTGGVEIIPTVQDKISSASKKERIIIFPKAYENPQSKAMPVLEALKIAWDKIKPCKLYFLAVVQQDIKMWIRTLPEEIQSSLVIYDRIPREETLRLMAQARVLLAPSLIDGVPNVLYEAMANKTFPIVSPIPTIRTVVSDPENVLFARNLYPEEIAQALIRAMNDDTLVDQVTERNLELVRRIANRSTIRSKVIDFYSGLLPS